MHSTIKDFLKTQGLLQYEVSNYAKKGYECKHNLSYWNGTPYIGIGAGACGRVIKKGTWFESRAIKNPNKYLNAVLTEKSSFEIFNKIDDTSRFEEIFLSYIRLNDGIPPKIIRKLSKKQGEKTKELVENGFLTLKNNNLTCTKKGMFYINSIVEFIFT